MIGNNYYSIESAMDKIVMTFAHIDRNKFIDLFQQAGGRIAQAEKIWNNYILNESSLINIWHTLTMDNKKIIAKMAEINSDKLVISALKERLQTPSDAWNHSIKPNIFKSKFLTPHAYPKNPKMNPNLDKDEYDYNERRDDDYDPIE